MAKRERVNWGALVKQASEFIVAEQNASYDFIRSKLANIGVGTVSKLLKRLQTKGLVRRGKKRAWIVIVNADGTPKDAATLPPVRRFYKKRHKGTRRTKANGLHTPAAHEVHEAARPEAKTDGRIPLRKKIEFLQYLANIADGPRRVLLNEIAEDLEGFSREEKFLKALRG